MKHEVIVKDIKNIGCSRQVIVDGITYNSVNQMRQALGLSESELGGLRKLGLSYAEAIDAALTKKEMRYAKQQARWQKEYEKSLLREEKLKAKQVSYNGITYLDLKSACDRMYELYNITITPNYIRTQAKKKNEPISKVFAEVVTVRRKKTIQCSEKV